VVFAGMSTDGKNPVIQVYINPLVNWVWIGGIVFVLGTLVALIPSKIRRVYPRTRIVATAKKPHAVTAQS
jgi:cytochrome c biogenesis factor